MKANEAPEKVFIRPRTFIGPWPPYIDENSKYGGIEYTRTNAFIERAVEWLKEQNEIIGVSFQEDFLERFKNYMEGVNHEN